MNSRDTSDAIVQEIVIDAPPDRIFTALTDPQERLRWWGTPGRFEVSEFASDLRVGGAWFMRFHTPYGESSVGGEYRVIDRPRELTFTWSPTWYEDAGESLVQFKLTQERGATTVRVTHSGLATEADRTNHRGWADILSWLQTFVQHE